MKVFCKLSFVAAAMLSAFPAIAQEDFAFTYRGRITAQQELPEELVVTYSLYTGENDDSPVWTQTKTERPAANGAFQSVISGDGLQSAFENQNARFLGLRLGTNAVEQYPRQEILAVPLAGYAATVEMAPFSPNFGHAKVECLEATTLSVGDLAVTNHLAFANGGNLTLENVEVGSGGRLAVKKPANGAVQLFGEAPLAYTNATEGIIAAETILFDGLTAKGGFLLMTTTDS